MPLLALLLAACSSPPPRAYGIGEPIPLGPYTVSVTRVETKNTGSSGSLVVRLRLRCPENPRELSRFMDKYVWAFTARDSAGNEHRGFLTPDLPSRTGRPGSVGAIRSQAKEPADLERWTVVFPVPADTRGFTLYVENQSPKAGQAGIATVALGR